MFKKNRAKKKYAKLHVCDIHSGGVTPESRAHRVFYIIPAVRKLAEHKKLLRWAAMWGAWGLGWKSLQKFQDFTEFEISNAQLSLSWTTTRRRQKSRVKNSPSLQAPGKWHETRSSLLLAVSLDYDMCFTFAFWHVLCLFLQRNTFLASESSEALFFCCEPSDPVSRRLSNVRLPLDEFFMTSDEDARSFVFFFSLLRKRTPGEWTLNY